MKEEIKPTANQLYKDWGNDTFESGEFYGQLTHSVLESQGFPHWVITLWWTGNHALKFWNVLDNEGIHSAATASFQGEMN